MKQSKTKKNLFSLMSNLQTYYYFKLDFQNVDQHTRAKWLIHDTKRRRTISCKTWNSPVEYPSRECKHGMKDIPHFIHQDMYVVCSVTEHAVYAGCKDIKYYFAASRIHGKGNVTDYCNCRDLPCCWEIQQPRGCNLTKSRTRRTTSR